MTDKTPVLKESTFPLNDNLEQIESGPRTGNPFVFMMDPQTTKLLIKLKRNLKVLGKDPIDANQLINEALVSKLTELLRKNIHPEETTDFMNEDHLANPQVGDSWYERPGTCYLRVVAVLGPDDFIVHTYVRCGSGLMPGRYRFNTAWLTKFVFYRLSIPGPNGSDVHFVADVTPMEKDDSRYTEMLRPDVIASELKYCEDVRCQEPPTK